MDKMRQWSIFTAVAVVAILAAGWMLVVSPQRSHVAELRQQAAAQESSNATLQSQVGQLEQQKKDLPQQQKLLSEFDTKVPQDPALPVLIRQLSGAAQSSGVDLVSLAPATPTAVTPPTATAPTSAAPTTTAAAPATATLQQITVTLNVTGSYFNIERFFNAVEQLPRAMKVSGWSIAFGSGSGSGGSSAGNGGASAAAAAATDELNATLTGVVFDAPPAAAPAATATAPTSVTPAS